MSFLPVSKRFCTLLAGGEIESVMFEITAIYNNIRANFKHLGQPVWVISGYHHPLLFKQTARPRYWLSLQFVEPTRTAITDPGDLGNLFLRFFGFVCIMRSFISHSIRLLVLLQSTN